MASCSAGRPVAWRTKVRRVTPGTLPRCGTGRVQGHCPGRCFSRRGVYQTGGHGSASLLADRRLLPGDAHEHQDAAALPLAIGLLEPADVDPVHRATAGTPRTRSPPRRSSAGFRELDMPIERHPERARGAGCHGPQRAGSARHQARLRGGPGLHPEGGRDATGPAADQQQESATPGYRPPRASLATSARGGHRGHAMATILRARYQGALGEPGATFGAQGAKFATAALAGGHLRRPTSFASERGQATVFIPAARRASGPARPGRGRGRSVRRAGGHRPPGAPMTTSIAPTARSPPT